LAALEYIHLANNPVSVALKRTYELALKQDFAANGVVPSLVTILVLVLVFAILIVLWPYGWFPVIAHFLWQFVLVARDDIKNVDTYSEKMPHTVALGIYFSIWFVFAILCLPFLLIGAIGALVAQG
jgi:hypothetical protein